MVILQSILIILLVAFCFRVRGGFGEKWGWKLPLCKWWFAIAWTLCSCYLMQNYNFYSWVYWQKIISAFIGARLSTQFCGWGEAVGCALKLRKPDPHEMNELDFDEFCDNFGWDAKDITILKISHKKKVYVNWVYHLKEFHLIDHAEAYGVTWLTLRGVLLSYLMASPLDNLALMLWGAPMGIIYWFAGWLYRHGLDDGKGGWRTAEWLYGAWLGLGAVLFIKHVICFML